MAMGTSIMEDVYNRANSLLSTTLCKVPRQAVRAPEILARCARGRMTPKWTLELRDPLIRRKIRPALASIHEYTENWTSNITIWSALHDRKGNPKNTAEDQEQWHALGEQKTAPIREQPDGSGLINKRGYKGAFAHAGSHAKYLTYVFNQTWAIICGVEDLVFYILRSLHAKAGGTPQHLLQSCLGYGAFSIVIDWGTHGLGRASWTNNKCEPSSCAKLVLPPFTLPLPSNIKEGFSSFCESLGKNKGNGQ
ncbi:hypothetical protein QJS04_geneDACA005248 [Acorus gramineus]|uniref:Uncharacterized protein n=1 Tax=Acorus gramineus TaxID=55184 RepID=A0AAV9AWI3_ACOGR|nr:hypothetical protein QJS04_geneDACA005248 [Acorus gramineus]